MSTEMKNNINTQTHQCNESQDNKVVQFASTHGNKSHKLHLDKYYTPRATADYVVSKTIELIGSENISEIVETSAGAGVFLDALHDYLTKNNLDIPVYGYDLEPDRDDIIQQDYLELLQFYQPGRLIIGNPPFGSRMKLAKKFFKKSVREGDYVSWILPGGLYDNNTTLYEFDLTYTELLGDVEYSGSKTVNSTFNIYERPTTKVLNKQGSTKKLQDITIYSENHREYRDMDDYDMRMVYWGTAGKILQDGDRDYAGVYKIKVHRDDIRQQVVDLLNTVDWSKEVSFSAMKSLKHGDIIDYLKRHISDLQ